VRYLHTPVASNLGKVGVLVALESDAPAEALSELGTKLAMHIAAGSPRYCRAEDIPAADLEAEKKVDPCASAVLRLQNLRPPVCWV